MNGKAIIEKLGRLRHVIELVKYGTMGPVSAAQGHCLDDLTALVRDIEREIERQPQTPTWIAQVLSYLREARERLAPAAGVGGSGRAEYAHDRIREAEREIARSVPGEAYAWEPRPGPHNHLCQCVECLAGRELAAEEEREWIAAWLLDTVPGEKVQTAAKDIALGEHWNHRGEPCKTCRRVYGRHHPDCAAFKANYEATVARLAEAARVRRGTEEWMEVQAKAKESEIKVEPGGVVLRMLGKITWLCPKCSPVRLYRTDDMEVGKGKKLGFVCYCGTLCVRFG